jgi:uncharacterized membrane protein YdbT with pleckstrin-like domain
MSTVALSGNTASDEAKGVLVVAFFGGLVGLFVAVIDHIHQQITGQVLTSWLRDMFVGFLAGLVIACVSIVVFTLYMHAKRRYAQATTPGGLTAAPPAKPAAPAPPRQAK